MQFFHYVTTTLLSSFLASKTMDSLDSPFTIEINGQPVARISDSASSRTQAKIATDSDAAVFTLTDGNLQCGGWMLGRNKTEDRSLLPKQVLWFKINVNGEKADSKEQVLPVAAEKDGDLYKIRFNGMHSWRGPHGCPEY
jgi:hypothetical protein